MFALQLPVLGILSVRCLCRPCITRQMKARGAQFKDPRTGLPLQLALVPKIACGERHLLYPLNDSPDSYLLDMLFGSRKQRGAVVVR